MLINTATSKFSENVFALGKYYKKNIVQNFKTFERLLPWYQWYTLKTTPMKTEWDLKTTTLEFLAGFFFSCCSYYKTPAQFKTI